MTWSLIFFFQNILHFLGRTSHNMDPEVNWADPSLYILLYISLQLGFCAPRLAQLGSIPETSSVHNAFIPLGIIHKKFGEYLCFTAR